MTKYKPNKNGDKAVSMSRFRYGDYPKEKSEKAKYENGLRDPNPTEHPDVLFAKSMWQNKLDRIKDV